MTDINVQSQDVRVIVAPVPSENLRPEAPTNFEAQPTETVGKNGAVQGKSSSPRPVSSISSGSSIVAFRDGDTGKLVIKLVGKQNNEVLAQFPNPIQLSLYATAGKIISGSTGFDQTV